VGRRRTRGLNANRLGWLTRAALVYAAQQLCIAMQRDHSVSMARCVQVRQFLSGRDGALLKLGLDIRFIPNPARVDGNLLQAANYRVVLVVVLEQRLIRVLLKGDKLLKSPQKKLLHQL
jgi:hypothetical protein